MSQPVFLLRCYMLSGRELVVSARRDLTVSAICRLLQPSIREVVGQPVEIYLVKPELNCMPELYNSSTLESCGITEKSKMPYVQIVLTEPIGTVFHHEEEFVREMRPLWEEWLQDLAFRARNPWL